MKIVIMIAAFDANASEMVVDSLVGHPPQVRLDHLPRTTSAAVTRYCTLGCPRINAITI